METIKGILEKVSKDDGIGKESGKPYTRFVFTIDGRKYSSFNADLVGKVKLGEFVEMRGIQGEKYFDMKSIGPAQDNTNYDPKVVNVVNVEEIESKPKPVVKDTGYHLTIEQQRVHALTEANRMALSFVDTKKELSNTEYYQLIRQNFEWINQGKL